MSTLAKLTGQDFDRMVERGAFVDLAPMKIELLDGVLRFMNPAGPIHEGEIQFLMEWSFRNTNPDEISIRVQSSINCGDHRPEPDLVWSRKLASRRVRPSEADVLLVIEVADSSVELDLNEKAKLYAEHGVPDYWVVDIKSEKVYVHRQPEHGTYTSVEVRDNSTSIAPLCRPFATLSLALLFDLDA